MEEPPADNPECSICNGQAVTDPNKVYQSKDEGAVFTRTCAQADNFARYITNTRQCDNLLADARFACCPPGSAPGAPPAGGMVLAGQVGIVASLVMGIGMML